MTEEKAPSTGILVRFDLCEMSDEQLQELLDKVTAEESRRQRKREKQSVKDAMNTEPKT